MTQEQRNKKAEQLRIAAQIVETGCEWEILRRGVGVWDAASNETTESCIVLGYEIRIKHPPAWKPPAPPEGRKWHRDDWTQDMLPDGWRPLLDGEEWIEGDQISEYDLINSPCDHITRHCRTRRPLPVPEGYRELRDDEKNGLFIRGAKYLYQGEWMSLTSGSYACKYQRIIVPVAKQRVPLEPCDVPPGTCIKPSNEYVGWGMICEMDSSGIHLGESRHLSFKNLMDNNWSIKRPTDTEWKPCSKQP